MNAKLAYLILALIVLLISNPAAGPAEEQEPEWFPAIQVEKQPVLDVPYVPTPPEVISKMLSMAGVSSRDVLYDLGSGDGRTVVAAAKERNARRAVGIDVDPQRIEESRANAKRAGVDDRVTFQEKDPFDVDLKEASVVTLYLLPAANLKLRPKLLRDLQPGTRIVSHDFDMGDWQPDRSVSLNGHTIYLWVVPANVNGTWKWSAVESGATHRYELRLRQQFQNVESAELLLDDAPKAVTGARVAGDLLEFAIQTKTGKKSLRIHFSATVTGDSLKGVVTTEQTGIKKKWAAERGPVGVMPVDAMSGSKVQL